MNKVVLVADDSLSVRKVVSIALQRHGFSCVEASDGHEALECFSRENVGLLLTDLRMPTMNGIELIRAVRSLPDYRYIPIIMITTDIGFDSLKGKQAGATGWITKPFTIEHLIGMVRQLLRCTPEGTETNPETQPE